jgi:hypothetical protein
MFMKCVFWFVDLPNNGKGEAGDQRFGLSHGKGLSFFKGPIGACP